MSERIARARGRLQSALALGLIGALALTACSSGSASPTASGGRVPSAPTALALTADGSTLVVSWAKPADPGSSAVSGYRLSVNDLRTAAVPADTLMFEVPDVQPGKSLTLAVVAVNAAGEGPPATSQLVMPAPSSTAAPTPSPTAATTSPTPSPTPTTPTSSSPSATAVASSPSTSASGPAAGAQPTTNPNAFVAPTVVSTTFLGCTALPTSPVTHHWQVEVVTSGGQNWTPVSATVHGTGLVVEADTDRSGLLMTYLTVTDPAGGTHRVPFPAGERITVLFATACP